MFKILDETLLILFTHLRLEYCPNAAESLKLLSTCMETNENLLQLGGSSAISECLSVSALNNRFQYEMNGRDEEEDDIVGENLFWSNTQKELLSRYSNGLIVGKSFH